MEPGIDYANNLRNMRLLQALGAILQLGVMAVGTWHDNFLHAAIFGIGGAASLFLALRSHEKLQGLSHLK